LRAEDLDYLGLVLRRRAGIVLSRSRPHLIESRLGPVARRYGFRDVATLLKELPRARQPLLASVTEAMTTKDSTFFRDRTVFDYVREAVLPQIVSARGPVKRLRLWSAACAAGQEAYSLAMILDEMELIEDGWSIELIASDLSGDQIARAEEGLYSDYEVSRGVSQRRLAQYFTKTESGWRISERLKRMVNFRAFNLLDSYGWLNEVDAVFCRNVLIFFDEATKLQAIEKISEVLLPDGVLVLGHAENVLGMLRFFERRGAAGCYAIKKQKPAIGYDALSKIA
jgi:chemotaxis protein methyltransferase CheR